jgi:hypothetical protein
MRILNIKSRTTLLSLKNEGKIRYSSMERYISSTAHHSSSTSIQTQKPSDGSRKTYLTGFNHGYRMAGYQPDLWEKLNLRWARIATTSAA